MAPSGSGRHGKELAGSTTLAVRMRPVAVRVPVRIEASAAWWRRSGGAASDLGGANTSEQRGERVHDRTPAASIGVCSVPLGSWLRPPVGGWVGRPGWMARSLAAAEERKPRRPTPGARWTTLQREDTGNTGTPMSKADLLPSGRAGEDCGQLLVGEWRARSPTVISRQPRGDGSH